ncbi:unnamed protein product [Prunus armeniaca]
MPHSDGYIAATLEISTFSTIFLFLLFLPQSAAKTTACGSSTCTAGGLLVRFPFQLRNNQVPSNCGYPGFDLSCNNRSQTILTLPSSGDFIVQSINYMERRVSINYPGNCLAKRYFNHDISLVNSPFSYLNPTNYTFLNCSSYKGDTTPIFCLGSDNYKVIAVPTRWFSPPFDEPLPINCSVILTTLVPSTFEWDYPNRGAELTWDMSECRSCELGGQVCGLKNHKSSKIQCSGSHFGSSSSGTARAEKYGLMMGLGIPLLLLTLYLGYRMYLNHHRPITEVSTITNRRPSTHIAGLDGATIESYPKTQLGESWELPVPNDNICPICLCEYQPKEVLRTIPECNHYFHANCIDEWLRRNATCPLCRNLQER